MRTENVYVLCSLPSLTSWVQVCKRQVYFLLVFLKCSKFTLVTQKQTPDLMTQSLDTLFALARTGLNVADPGTHDAAYDHLKCAAMILRIGEDVDPKSSERGSSDILTWDYLMLSWTEIDLRRLSLFCLGRFFSLEFVVLDSA
jgi:hypothetical protein